MHLAYQVNHQAIVVLETIDAIRALSEIEREEERSIEKTDLALGITGKFLPKVEKVLQDEKIAEMP